MFLRQNFIFCRLRRYGVWGLGCCLGSLLTCWQSASFSSGWNGYFLRSWEFRQKSKDSKKCYLIQFLHIFIGVISCQFPSGCRPTVSWWRSARAIYNAVFRWLSDLGELWRGFKRVIRLRLPSCGRWWVLIPSSCEKVGLYIYNVFIGIPLHLQRFLIYYA